MQNSMPRDRILSISAVAALFFLTVAPAVSRADDKPYIAVGAAKTKKTAIAIPAVKTGDDSGLNRYAKTINEVVNNDLSFMDLFRFLDPSAFVENQSASGITTGTFKLSNWSSIGADLVLKSALARQGENLALESFLFDTSSGKQLLGKKYVAAPGDIRTLAHTLANNVVEALTGLPGIFLTKIAMSCDRTGKKEIYMMDFDGGNVKQVTQHRSIAFAPTWSPDGGKIVYSVYVRHRHNIRNIDLYQFDFNTSTYRMLSNRKGINSGAAYSPDGSKIALTMSFLGNPEIFTLNPVTNTVTRLTRSFGFDVDPAWSPDGRKIAFVSSRTGQPMIFSMNVDGSQVQRLTYAGKYNATPTWSPQNNKIAFAGWLETQFDIFIMNPDGSHIERLTKNQGNNEDPHFSPDGNFVVFSSNRTGQKNIYAMNVDGTFVKRLTYGMGNCVTPKWSLPPVATAPAPASVSTGQ